MSELDKLEAGQEYKFTDPEVAARKIQASALCHQYRQLDPNDSEQRSKLIRQIFGTVGEDCTVEPGFACDNGKNIHVGDNFLANYNFTVLDIAAGRGSHVLPAHHSPR